MDLRDGVPRVHHLRRSIKSVHISESNFHDELHICRLIDRSQEARAAVHCPDGFAVIDTQQRTERSEIRCVVVDDQSARQFIATLGRFANANSRPLTSLITRDCMPAMRTRRLSIV